MNLYIRGEQFFIDHNKKYLFDTKIVLKQLPRIQID